MPTNIPPTIYHHTNSAVLAQIAEQRQRFFTPKLQLVKKGIYPFGGSVIPELIIPPISQIAQCDWSLVSFCENRNYEPEKGLKRICLKTPDDCKNHLKSQRAWFDNGRKDGTKYLKPLADALSIMDYYHKGLVDVLEKMSAAERRELTLAIPVVLGADTKQIGECLKRDASRTTFFSAAPFPLDLITKVYCVNAPKVMATLKKLELEKYWKGTA